MLRLFAHFVLMPVALAGIAALGAAALALGGAGEANAGLIFSNITGTSSPGGYLVGLYPGAGDYAIGSDFTAPSDVGPAVGGAIGVEYSSGLDQLDLTLAENLGGDVGPTVATATLTNIPPTLAILDFTLSAPTTLTPGASYWLIATADDPTAVFYWWTPAIPAGAYDQTVSYNGGSFSFDTNLRPGQFAIFSVPEPSTWTMLIIGFGGLAFAMSRASIRSRSRPSDAAGGAARGRGGGPTFSQASHVRHSGSRNATNAMGL